MKRALPEGGMKFGFSMAKKPKNTAIQTPQNALFKEDVVPVKQTGELITKFDQSGSKKKKEKPLVIPLPQDVNKKVKNDSMMAKITRGEENKMEEDVKPDDFNYDPIALQETEEVKDLPLLLRNRDQELAKIEDEDERFKADVNKRPNEASIEDYEKVPIGVFGEAMLRGMGWKPGKSIGKNGKGLVAPIEFIPRPRGLGLGSQPKPEQIGNKPLKTVYDSAGNMKNVRNLDQKLVPVKMCKYSVGDPIYVISGEHKGISGNVDKIIDNTNFLICFASGLKDQIKGDYLIHENDKKKYLETQSKQKVNDTASKSNSSSSSSSRRGWITPGITVRIISKSFRNGKYYCKRVRIVDITGSDECSVDCEGVIIDGVRQSMLETALPRPGGSVMILSGRDKGKTGHLVERNSETCVAVVQLEDDDTVHSYDFNYVAEYVN